MIKLCIHRKEYLSKRLLNARYLAFVILRKILFFLTPDQSQYMFIWINCCLISNMIHQLLKFQFQDILKKMIEFQLMLNLKKSGMIISLYFINLLNMKNWEIKNNFIKTYVGPPINTILLLIAIFWQFIFIEPYFFCKIKKI